MASGPKAQGNRATRSISGRLLAVAPSASRSPRGRASSIAPDSAAGRATASRAPAPANFEKRLSKCAPLEIRKALRKRDRLGLRPAFREGFARKKSELCRSRPLPYAVERLPDSRVVQGRL